MTRASNDEIRILTPSGMLGYGFPIDHFKLGLAQKPHAITIDSQGRIFVADRSNNRVQIFDQEGNFLAEWKQFGRPSGVYIDRNDTLYVADHQ